MSKILIKTLIVLIPFSSLAQKLVIKHLNTNINTYGAEFNFQQISEKVAYYSSSSLGDNGKYQTLIFRSEKKNGEWNQGKYFNLGKKHSYANISHTKEKKIIYFNVIDEEGNSKIAFKKNNEEETYFLNNKINLPLSNNTQAHQTNYEDQSIFYFVSDRKGGFGGYDIWFTIIDKSGNFGEPINVGERINTEYDEITPFFNNWTKELYFSSNRNEESGFDIYKNKGYSNLWEKTKNVNELNSKVDDLYLIFYNELSGHLSSNRPPSLFTNQENCCNDIFSFKYKTKKNRFNDSIKKHLPISLYFHNDEPDPKNLKITTEKTYKDTYISFYILKNKYLQNSQEKKIEDFFENTLKKNYNKLNSTLAYVLKSLKNGNEMELHIKGFASPLYEKKYNINLTKRRISSFINMLNTFKNGQLKQFIKSGKLKIIKIPFGENMSNENVSDDPKDRIKSVYSTEAILERKIEIVEIIEL